MKLMICGASGMIGQALVTTLKDQHDLTLVGRSADALMQQFKHKYTCLAWNDLSTQQLALQESVINLAGENIGAKKWSSAQKQKILDSRLETTGKIAHLCVELGKDSPRILNASAIGIYGRPESLEAQQQTIFDESSQLHTPPTDFLCDVGQQWENALAPAKQAGVSVVNLRFAVVLSTHGGALQKMLPSFKLGLGAIIGSGKQPFSWVALPDVVSAIRFLLEKPEQTGAFNVVADEVVSQATFAKTLAACLHRPCLMRLPSGIVKLLFGEMGEELLLNGIHAKASRLKQLGFNFTYPTLTAALQKILTT